MSGRSVVNGCADWGGPWWLINCPNNQWSDFYTIGWISGRNSNQLSCTFSGSTVLISFMAAVKRSITNCSELVLILVVVVITWTSLLCDGNTNLQSRRSVLSYVFSDVCRSTLSSSWTTRLWCSDSPVHLCHPRPQQRKSWAWPHLQVYQLSLGPQKAPWREDEPDECHHSYNGETIKIRQQPRLPEELMNACLTEGAPEQSKFHLACVDGGHGRVAKSANAQRRLQLHLSTSFSPQPADKGECIVSHSHN